MKKNIAYFEKTGSANMDETVKLAFERAMELGVKDIVVATNHGKTALKVAQVFDPSKFNVVAVTISASFESEGWVMTIEEREKLLAKKIKVFTGTHAFGDDVGSAFSEKFGGRTFNEVVAQTLYRFSQGMKVSSEIILMAADAGLIPVDKEVIAIAGTESGADTAIVAKSAYPRKFLDFKILEIVAKPREG